MQVVTTVKTTMSEIKKALRLLNPEIPAEFVLDIDIECNAEVEVDKVSSVEQATEDSNDWINVPRGWIEPYCPTKCKIVDVEVRDGGKRFSLDATEYCESWIQEDYCGTDIVKYRVVR